MRGFYKIFIKNRFIRFAWMLGLSVWGVKWATDTFLVNKNAFFSKTIYNIPTDDITTFTIQKGDEEMIFARTDSGWLVVKNNVTLPISNDSVTLFLQVLKGLKSHIIKKLPDIPPSSAEQINNTEKPNIVVFITRKNNITDSLSIFYAEKDSATGNTYTYIKLPEERLLHGVTPDLNKIFGIEFNSFRNNTLFSFDRAKISKITFRNSADTVSFYAKDSINWTFYKDRFSVLTDSFNHFVQQIGILRAGFTNAEGGKFYDGSTDFIDPKNIVNQLIVYFQEDSTILTTYRRERFFVLHSSQNEGNYFQIDSINTIFKNPDAFVKLKKVN